MVQASRHDAKASNAQVYGEAWRHRLIGYRTISFSSAW